MAKRFDGGTSRFERKREEENRYAKTLPGEDDEPLPEPVEPIKTQGGTGRNDPCPCGSGKKYKKCCGK
jgi:uncharacterized protein YecA (UPF0149 family)